MLLRGSPGAAEYILPIPMGYQSHDRWIVEFADGLNAKVNGETPLQYCRRHESNESQLIANRRIKIISPSGIFLQIKVYLNSGCYRAGRDSSKASAIAAGRYSTHGKVSN